MRLSAGDVTSLPLACALFDRQGHLLHATPEWQGFSLGALTYDSGIGSLVVVPDGCSPDVDGLVTELIGEVVAAAPGLRPQDRIAVEMLASALALVAGRGPMRSARGSVTEVIEYVREGVRRTVPTVVIDVAVEVDAEVSNPAALALGLVQLVRNAVRHGGAERVTLRVGRGPTFRVEWTDPDSSGAEVAPSRRPDQRPRWGLGFARLLADSMGGVVTAPAAVADGVLATSIGLGGGRLAVPIASAVRGQIERATRAWDEETGLPPGAPVDARVGAALRAAEATPGQIGYADIVRARVTEARAWLAVAPQSSLGRARDVLRGMQHENSLLAAPEPHATRIFALASTLASAVSGETPEAVPASTWARDFGPACAALGVEPAPTVDADRLRYPEPRLTAYLLATLDGRLVETDSPAGALAEPAMTLVASAARAGHPVVRLMGGRDGAITLTA